MQNKIRLRRFCNSSKEHHSIFKVLHESKRGFFQKGLMNTQSNLLIFYQDAPCNPEGFSLHLHLQSTIFFFIRGWKNIATFNFLFRFYYMHPRPPPGPHAKLTWWFYAISSLDYYGTSFGSGSLKYIHTVILPDQTLKERAPILVLNLQHC